MIFLTNILWGTINSKIIQFGISFYLAWRGVSSFEIDTYYYGHLIIESVTYRQPDSMILIEFCKIDPELLAHLKVATISDTRYCPGTIGVISDFDSIYDWFKVQSPEIQKIYVDGIRSGFYKKFHCSSVNMMKQILVMLNETASDHHLHLWAILDPAHAEFIFKIVKKYPIR